MESSRLKLILASASPRRKELLGYTGIPFEILTENVIEESTHSSPVDYCRQIALTKGEAVATKLINSRKQESFFIVSADTIVEFRGRIFNKPADRNEARDFLNSLSGKTHSVFTAVILQVVHNGKIQTHSFVDESRVTFDQISSEVMETYLDTGDSMDKAGAYGIQGPSLTFISKVEGSYSNVVGFPLSRFMLEADAFLKKTFEIEGPWQKLF